MPSQFQVAILSADEVFYEGPCVSLILPTRQGMMGVMAHESNLVVSTVPGVLRLRTPEGKELTASVSHGIAKIADAKTILLVETLERPEDIDAERALQAERRAKGDLKNVNQLHQEHLQAEAELARARARLKAIGRIK